MSETRDSQELIKGEIVEAVSPTPAIIMDISYLQKVAKVYAASSFLPASWRKLPEGERLANLIIIVNRAGVLKCDPLLLLQNLDIIAGRMCWRSSFLLQLLQAHGWAGSRYEFEGDPNAPEFWGDDANGCTFSAINPATGEREKGTKITVAMIKGEGWLSKEGSKWRTMPEQMIKYRAVAFFARTNAPAVMGGFYSQDEIEDIVAQERAQAPMVTPAQVVEAEPEPVPEPPLPADIQAYISKVYEQGVAAIQADKSLITLADKGSATDALVARCQGLTEAARRAPEGFRAKYLAPPPEKINGMSREAWAHSPSNPGGSCYHD